MWKQIARLNLRVSLVLYVLLEFSFHYLQIVLKLYRNINKRERNYQEYSQMLMPQELLRNI